MQESSKHLPANGPQDQFGSKDMVSNKKNKEKTSPLFKAVHNGIERYSRSLKVRFIFLFISFKVLCFKV